MRALTISAVLWAGAAQAQLLALPGNAALQGQDSSDPASYTLPIARWAEGVLPGIELQGVVVRQAWRVDAPGITTLQLLRPLQAQLEAEGFEVLFACDTQACGGFDFRFAIDVMAAPDMYVDLGDFRFLSAQRGEDEGLGVLVSRSSRAGFVQIVHVTANGSAAQLASPEAAPVRAQPVPAVPGSFAAMLEQDGRVVLTDLSFVTGSSTLGEGPYASLQALAEYLRANPDRQVALVGHTDAEGSLEGNIALSRRRAASVLDRLAEVYGIPRGQMEAQGMGYLAPLSTNLTEEGRDLNRRVEVIVTSTP